MQKYITGDHILIPSETFFELESSSLVSDLYDLIQRMLYLIFVRSNCKFTLSFIKHCVIKKGSLYLVSYFYAVWLVSMTSSPPYSHSQLYAYSLGCYLY